MTKLRCCKGHFASVFLMVSLGLFFLACNTPGGDIEGIVTSKYTQMSFPGTVYYMLEIDGKRISVNGKQWKSCGVGDQWDYGTCEEAG